MPLTQRVDKMNKGYYNEYKITSYAEDDDVIHGQSYAIRASNIDFVTWKQNNDTRSEYWMKLHTKSSKEIRIKVDLDGLNEILATVGNRMVNHTERNRNEYELDKKYK
jgi:phage tail tube protein FII